MIASIRGFNILSPTPSVSFVPYLGKILRTSLPCLLAYPGADAKQSLQFSIYISLAKNNSSTMSTSPSFQSPTSCRNLNVRRPSYSVADGDNESLVHALSMGLRRSRDGAQPVGALAEPPSTSFRTVNPSRKYLSDERRSEMIDILDAALNIMDECNANLLAPQGPPLDSVALP
jgi:hypothetical protein